MTKEKFNSESSGSYIHLSKGQPERVEWNELFLKIYFCHELPYLDFKKKKLNQHDGL